MYSRERVTNGKSNGYLLTTDCDGPKLGGLCYPPSYTSANIPWVRGESKITLDSKTANYSNRKRKGEIIMNSFDIQQEIRYSIVGTVIMGTAPYWGSRTYQGDLAFIAKNYPVAPAWYESRKEDARASTLINALSKVASTDFQGLVSVAEAHKTAKTLARPFAGVDELLLKMLNKRSHLLRMGASIGAAAAAAWNEYRFGWKPLLYDIQGQFEAYCNRNDVHSFPVRLVSRSSEKVEWDSGPVKQVVNPVDYPISFVDQTGSTIQVAKVSSGVLYEMSDENLNDANRRRMGLRLSDVPSALWELVPWSFVVDRFVSVGKWLDAITPKPNVRVLGTWTTTVEHIRSKNTLNSISNLVGDSDGLHSVVGYGGGSCESSRFNMNRRTNPDIPPLPSINHRELSLTQQQDHLALIYQSLYNFGVKHLG